MSRFFTTPGRAFFTTSASEFLLQDEEQGLRPVAKKNACGIWVKNALRAW
ncbi:MAG: hypothetical protein IJ498_03550 [Akkermansia sp.]|nr:hypothetical protein [Akkermansia sp.]